jgi:hypothetical protein
MADQIDKNIVTSHICFRYKKLTYLLQKLRGACGTPELVESVSMAMNPARRSLSTIEKVTPVPLPLLPQLFALRFALGDLRFASAIAIV